MSEESAVTETTIMNYKTEDLNHKRVYSLLLIFYTKFIENKFCAF